MVSKDDLKFCAGWAAGSLAAYMTEKVAQFDKLLYATMYSTEKGILDNISLFPEVYRGFVAERTEWVLRNVGAITDIEVLAAAIFGGIVVYAAGNALYEFGKGRYERFMRIRERYKKYHPQISMEDHELLQKKGIL